MCARGVSEVQRCLEITMFRMPCLPRNTAEEAPAGPAPTTSTSVSIVAPMTVSVSSSDASIGVQIGPVNTMLYDCIVLLATDWLGRRRIHYVGVRKDLRSVGSHSGDRPGGSTRRLYGQV